MSRILVVGTSCSGKSTLARRLAASRGIPYVELDALFWLPGWTPRPAEAFKTLVAEAVAGESWVMDGNYGAVQDLILSRATGIVWLNYSFGTVWGRALRRTFRRVFGNEVACGGNRETFQQAFLSRESILVWILKTFWSNQRRYRRLFSDPAWAHLERVELCSAEQAERLT